jgi:tetrapyrrole methylase family protein/MazG family protein
MQPTIVLVGAGIANASPPSLSAALEGCTTVVCRTLRHPGLPEALSAIVEPEVPILSCDDLYDGATDFDELYPKIVDRIVSLAKMTSNARLAYVVPGSPAIGERSVQLLLTVPDVAIEIGAGLGLIDYVALRLHMDPIDGLKIVDAIDLLEQLPTDSETLLALQCFDPMIAREITAKVEERNGRVQMLYHLGQSDEKVIDVIETSAELEICDHLTSLFITDLAPLHADLNSLIGIVHRLRAECPWDAQQTHRSLARHLLEEAHEVVQAIDDLESTDAGAMAPGPMPIAHLEEELGDLLLQVLMHAEIGSEVEDFDLASIARALQAKLVRRHPHVFADIDVDSAEQVVANWETIKAEERRNSAPSQVPEALPAALRLQKVYRKLTGLGLTPDELIAKVNATSEATPSATNFALTALTALTQEIDLEETLRRTARLLEELMPG